MLDLLLALAALVLPLALAWWLLGRGLQRQAHRRADRDERT
jgi:hypothetical protein